MDKKTWGAFLRRPTFKEWWMKELSQKKNKITDLSTRKFMVMEKRVLIDKPKFNDLAKFSVEQGLIVKIYSNKNNNWVCRFIREVSSSNSKSYIMKTARTPKAAMELALLDYFKLK